MKWTRSLLPILILAYVVSTSCSSRKTLAQMMKEEEENIESFIAKQGFQIITTLPSDTIFKEKQYMKFSNGLYMNIKHRGDLTHRPKKDTTNVFMRYKDFYILSQPDDSTYKDGNWLSTAPVEFFYNQATRDAFDYPLQFVGDSAIVSFIMPSKLGSTDEQSAVIPYYYGHVRYVFEKWAQ